VIVSQEGSVMEACSFHPTSPMKRFISSSRGCKYTYTTCRACYNEAARNRAQRRKRDKYSSPNEQATRKILNELGKDYRGIRMHRSTFSMASDGGWLDYFGQKHTSGPKY
jgi:hypothetical protein